MRGLSCTTTDTTFPSNSSENSTSPLSPRALRRPQRPRVQPGSTRPKSIIAVSHPYQRPSRKPSRNLDDMEIDSPTQANFIESLIQEIQDTPVSPGPESPATSLPRQNKSNNRWSGAPTPPVESYYLEDESVTPEQERAAIARYRRERFSLPEHEWWKLESKHRIATAALRHMEEAEAPFIPPAQESTVRPLAHQKEATKIVLEALAFTHTPNPEAVKPVGENGLDLESSAHIISSLIRPLDCDPEAWEQWQHREGITNLQHHAYLGARLSAYSFENGDIFNINRPRVRKRLRKVEECWQHKTAAMNIETQFWNAVFERLHQPNDFVQRDAYLLQANAVEFAAKEFVAHRAERKIHEEIFNRYLTSAFDCPEEDQEGLIVDVPELANALLNVDSFAKNGQISMSLGQISLDDTTKRLGMLRVD